MKLFKKGTKINSILESSCPVCQEGKMYKSHTYDLKNMVKMEEKCSCCGKVFAPEPSFFEGAMYVSYAFSVAQSLGLIMLFYFFFPEIEGSTVILIAGPTAILLAPLSFRLSRNIWANMFMSFDKQYR